MELNIQHDCIGVFDSGIGGLSVANAISGLLPKENLLYIADNANAPYGSKPPAEVQKYAHQLTEILLAAGAKMIVVACNTATAMAINSLREKWLDVPFVGMEPAIKPAANATKTGVIGVMATQITLGSERYKSLAGRFAKSLTVMEDPCRGLVPLIEAGTRGKELTQMLHAILDPMLDAGADTLVLGCTHYPIVEEEIRSICGSNVEIIDPAMPTARQVKRLLNDAIAVGAESENLDEVANARYDFFATGSAVSIHRTLLELENLNKYRALVS
ncbi:MAG: glutamate racemase [Bacteroidota bacterium]